MLDLEALRVRAVGGKWDVIAISYGTQLAQAYARDFPSSIRQMVLAGAEPLNGTLKPPGRATRHLARLDSAVNADTALRKIIPKFTTLADTVVAQLTRQPVPATVVDPLDNQPSSIMLGAFDVVFATTFAFGDRRTMLNMPAMYLQMLHGDYADMARMVTRFRRYNGTAMAVTTDCATGWSARDSAAVANDTSIWSQASNFPFPAICNGWPHQRDAEVFRSRFRSKIPVLLIAGSMDGRTTLEDADYVRSQFDRSALVRVIGAAHDDDLFLSHPGILKAMGDFLGQGVAQDLTLVLPPWKFVPPVN